MNRTTASLGAMLAVCCILLSQTCRAEPLVAFLPYENATNPDETQYSLMIVDLTAGAVAQEVPFEGTVSAVDVVDELGTVYLTILPDDGSNTQVVGLDLQTRQIVFEAELPAGVIGAYVDELNGRLYAADRYAGELIEIDLFSSASWQHPFGEEFHTIQRVRNSRFLMVSGSDGARLWDMDDRTFLDTDYIRMRMPLLSGDGERIYGAHYLVGRVHAFDFQTGEFLDTADTGVFWPRVELPESDSRIQFISGAAAGEVNFETGQATIDFGLAGTRFPSVLTTHGDFIVLAEPLDIVLCPPLLPCEPRYPPASIFVFDRENGELIREVVMPPGGVVTTFGRFLSETARGAPEPVGVSALHPVGLLTMICLLALATGVRLRP